MTNEPQSLVGLELQNVYLSGIVDTDQSPADFHYFGDSYYLVTDRGVFAISRPRNETHLFVYRVNMVGDLDQKSEDYPRCQTSLFRCFFTSSDADHRIVKVAVYQSSSPSCSAIELTLSTGQSVFFDPMFLNGMNFGGVEQRELWIANNANFEVTSWG